MEMTTFEDILNEMEPYSADIICDRLINLYYVNFDLSNLKMLLIGSSGVWYTGARYNRVLTLVAEEGYNHIPQAVENFQSNLYDAFPSIYFDEPPDYTCQQLRRNTLFINICLTEYANDDANAICSITFINKLLAELRERDQPIAILDFRLTKHTHENNLNDCIIQDSRALATGEHFTDDPAYEIINAGGYHLYRRFGNPGVWHYHEDDAEQYRTMLLEIRDQGYPIDLMYQPVGEGEGTDQEHSSYEFY